MFKFDFDFEQEADGIDECIKPGDIGDAQREATVVDQHPPESFSEVLLTQLLDALPPLISYSPLLIPLSSGAHVKLARRDLFDARFQLISQSDEDGEEDRVDDKEKKCVRSTSALGFLDAPSDLLPGLYEGGLKTWECSLDLVDCLDGLETKGIHGDIRNKRVLEIGCGTAVPSSYLLHQLFASDPLLASAGVGTQVHLQDYNKSVLELVTLPNIILAWYISPSSESYRASESSDSAGPFDPSSPGVLALSPALKTAFLDSLRTHGLSLRFFAGSWDTFDLSHAGSKYDLVLSSETIYRTQNLDALIRLMEGACGCGREGPETPLDKLAASKLSLAPPSHLSAGVPQYLCLVAAKVLYFGVGGGIPDFVQIIEDPRHERGRVETVWERKLGVGRKVIRIEWRI